MKRLLSCLLLASHCALSSRSDASAFRVSQSADLDVLEGQRVRISCCWTGNFRRVRVKWLKNAISYPHRLCRARQTSGEKCECLGWPNVTMQDSGTYVCQANVEIPLLMEAEGNGTRITVTRQRSNGTAGGDTSASPLGLPLWLSLALVALVLLFGLTCVCKIKQTKGVSRVIYESPHLDSDDADMDKRSNGSSSTGSAQWCQVLVYESVDYFERVEMKQDG